jgi:hypothetical protein
VSVFLQKEKLMRIRTAVAATALAALAVLGGAGAATAAGPDDHDGGTNLVDSNIITTWVTDSFNGISKSFNTTYVVVFGDQS